jgi:lipoyl(octanoyl) transferase
MLDVKRLGLVPYRQAHALQQELQEQRVQGSIPDTLLLLEHPPVVTLGRGAKAEHVLWTPDTMRKRGIEVVDTGRGGDVTFHGPGQLVAYAIVDLRPDRCDVRRYVRDLEEVMIRTCQHYGLDAIRVQGLTGVWVQGRKIGAIGVRISRWVTMHGVALNVNTDLNYFQSIVPCGIANKSVTSLRHELGTEVSMPDISMQDVQNVFTRHFGEVFDRKPATSMPESASLTHVVTT